MDGPEIPTPFILIIIIQNLIPWLETELKQSDLMVILEYYFSLCNVLISCSYHALSVLIVSNISSLLMYHSGCCVIAHSSFLFLLSIHPKIECV